MESFCPAAPAPLSVEPVPPQVRMVMAALRCRRPHDELVGESAAGRPDYLRRWFIIPQAKNRQHWRLLKSGNAYLHHFNRSDDDRALHDHPWMNVSILLSGRYIEHMPGGVTKLRRPGNIVVRGAGASHRIELLKDPDGNEIPCWTIFLTGPKVRDWGFHCPRGWRHNEVFTDPLRPGEVGRGCAD